MFNSEWHLERLTTPEGLWMVTGIGALLVVLFLLLHRRRDRSPYQRRGPLFSPAEARFLQVLERTVGEQARVYAKVRLADLVAVEEDISGRRFWQAFNAIACKHVDYVLCDPDDHQVLCVIELDDRSHEHPERKARDAFVDQVMASAGIAIVHFPVKARYHAAEVRERLERMLG